jgi:hypothetical protein
MAALTITSVSGGIVLMPKEQSHDSISSMEKVPLPKSSRFCKFLCDLFNVLTEIINAVDFK